MQVSFLMLTPPSFKTISIPYQAAMMHPRTPPFLINLAVLTVLLLALPTTTTAEKRNPGHPAFPDISLAEGKDFYDCKCSACVSIVAELERNLELEVPRANIDLRNTLRAPGDGPKKKVVMYEVSELRAIETIEALCVGMDQYGITKEESGFISFQRYNAKGAGSVKIAGTMTIGDDKFMSNRKMLQNYCDYIVEEHEDTVIEAIRAAGLAKLAIKQEELKAAKARREGRRIQDDFELDERTRAYATLNLDPIATMSEVKKNYRQLSKSLHPDKIKVGDPESSKKLQDFHSVAKAYELLTGEALHPYGDLYREVCIDIVDVCGSEEEIDDVRAYFPKYKGSKLKGMTEDDSDVQGRLGNHQPGRTKDMNRIKYSEKDMRPKDVIDQEKLDKIQESEEIAKAVSARERKKKALSEEERRIKDAKKKRKEDKRKAKQEAKRKAAAEAFEL